jgi:hypothetical protein
MHWHTPSYVAECVVQRLSAPARCWRRGLSHWFKKRRAVDADAPTEPPAGWEDVLAAVAHYREYTPALPGVRAPLCANPTGFVAS